VKTVDLLTVANLNPLMSTPILFYFCIICKKKVKGEIELCISLSMYNNDKYINILYFLGKDKWYE
jgi:hypothetical protein